LDRELEKVNSFYLYKRAEMERRLRILRDKYRTLYQTPPSPAIVGDKSGSFHGADPETEAAFLAALLETKDQLHKIVRYSELNKNGFMKILKK
jgi:glycerophosphodiester phosphodiesterase